MPYKRPPQTSPPTKPRLVKDPPAKPVERHPPTPLTKTPDTLRDRGLVKPEEWPQ